MSTAESEVKEVLQKFKRIAVIGISDEPSRASFGVSRYLVNAGYDVVGVRPGGATKEIHGKPVYERLADVPGPLEIIDVFRRSDAIPDVVEQVLAELKRRPKGEGPKVLWLQLGITHPEAEARAREHGLIVISDRCIKIDHAHLL
jgi:predicted CoA-binding protein